MTLTPRDEQEKLGAEIIKFPTAPTAPAEGSSTPAEGSAPPVPSATEPKVMHAPPAMEFRCGHGSFFTWAPVAGAWRVERKGDACKCEFAPPIPGITKRRQKPPKPTYTVEVPHQREDGKLQPIDAHHGGMKDRERLKEVLRLAKKLPTVPAFPCKEKCGKCCETPLEMLVAEWDYLSARPGPNKILDERTAAGRHIMVERRTPHAIRVQMVSTPTQEPIGVCPFLNSETKACGIYNERPFVCRAYGQHWFFRCREGVENPAALEIPDKVMQKWSVLAGKEYANRPLETWDALHEIVDAWRKEKPDRHDKMPGYDEIADRFRARSAPEGPHTPDGTPRYGEAFQIDVPGGPPKEEPK